MIACSRYPADVERALKLAGDNRTELEKVLEHYSVNQSDSLKLKAAMFLIENMPWHYSYGGKYMESYIRSIDSCYSSWPIEVRMTLYNLPENYPALYQRLEIKPDVQFITADYLIHNIDLSFRIWQESSWLSELHFDNFCEYLLPYRLNREPLIYWKDSIRDNFRTIIKDATELSNSSKDAYKLYLLLKENLMKDIEYVDQELPIPDEVIGTYKVDCFAGSNIYAYLWRMCGIPTAVDVLPRYGDGNYRHIDISIVDERIHGSVPVVPGYSVAKAYRTTFSINRTQILESLKDYVPSDAKNPFYKDVTTSYVRTADITIKPKTGRDRPEYLYLGVFSLGWDYVAHAKIKQGKATFKDVGVGVVYIPFYYVDHKQVFASDPFYLDAKKQMHYLSADKNNTQTVTLARKYKLADYKIWWSRLFINGRFEAAKDENFTTPIPVFTITDNSWWREVTVPVDTSVKTRFYRFMNAGMPVDLAEIHFYDTNGTEVKGKWIGDSTTMKNPDLPNIYDSDRLTFAAIQSWVGVDFGREVALSKIEYTPRNDANGIYPGMKYELLYFDRDQWVSMGVKIETNNIIMYDEVPRGALLWLHNLTEGREERIFIYQDGKQRWL